MEDIVFTPGLIARWVLMGVGGGWWEVGVLVLYPVHLCIHNCNTRACALLGVSLQCHLDLLQLAGQRGENEKFKQFQCYLVSLQVSTTTNPPDEILLFTSISDLSREISSQFQFKLFKIVSEMSGLSFLISFPLAGSDQHFKGWFCFIFFSTFPSL